MGSSAQRQSHASWRRLCGLVSLVSLSLIAQGASASADVIEIGPQGQVERIVGPVRLDAEGRAPLTLSAPPVSQAPSAPPEIASTLRAAAAQRALSPALIEAVAYVESRFQQAAVSPAGAVGVMQLMPGTARDLGVDPRDQAQNIAGGTAYLRQMLELFDGDLERALAAYNAGPAAVRRYGGVPPFPETRRYVAAVLDRLAATLAQEVLP